MKINHAGDVHAVNVVRPKNRHQVWIGLLDQIHILIDCVGGAPVPRLVFRTHLRRYVDDEVALQQPAELPALAQMLQQRLAEELSEHVNRVNARIDEVAQDKIDDPVLASEWNGGLGAFAGQRIEPGAFTSGQHDAQNLQVGTSLRSGFLWVELVVSQAVLLKLPLNGKLSKTTVRWRVREVR